MSDGDKLDIINILARPFIDMAPAINAATVILSGFLERQPAPSSTPTARQDTHHVPPPSSTTGPHSRWPEILADTRMVSSLAVAAADVAGTSVLRRGSAQGIVRIEPPWTRRVEPGASMQGKLTRPE